ncbi:MAG: hypothetical protein GXP48_04685, partial [Acidobacteria bacterium]|nr:hypothetical protein [Acidobacteriota bacterium]
MVNQPTELANGGYGSFSTESTVNKGAAILIAILVVASCRGGPLEEGGRAADTGAALQDTHPAATKVSDGLGEGWLAHVQKGIAVEEYRITRQGGRFHAVNRAGGFRAWFDDGVVEIVPRTGEDGRWSVRLAVTGLGRLGQVADLERAEAGLGGCYHRGESKGVTGKCLQRLELERGAFKEWYENRADGLEQGCFIAERPAGVDPLAIRLEADGLEARPGPGGAVRLVDGSGKALLGISGVRAEDAEGRTLGCRLEVGDNGVLVVVDDLEAEYPVETSVRLVGLLGLSGSADWTAESDQAGAYFAYSVSSAGDVNGDGFADVIVGAPHYDNGEADEGRAFVFYGSASGLQPNAIWTAESDQAGANFGSAVSTAGDVNGDGYADLLIGASRFDNGETDEGRVFVYYGSPASPSLTADWSAESDQAGAGFGAAVSTAGDINGDGYADVIVGASQFDDGETDEGRVFVYYGSRAGLPTTASWSAESDQADAYFGSSVSSAGDVNGDGYVDVIVGATHYDNGETDEGRAYVFLGSATGLSTTAAWTAESDQANARFGSSVSSAGDVNGDGYADVIVGALYYNGGEEYEGRAYVYHGSASGLSSTAAWTAESNQVWSCFGNSVSFAGDVNGDGFADVIVGARYFNNGEESEGRAYVYYGSSSGLSSSPAWTGEPNQANARFGWSVSNAGDVNGDGFADVIVGAYYYDNPQSNEGRAYVYYGSASGLSSSAGWNAEPGQAKADFGWSVSYAGDVNGDGYDDIIVGAPSYDNGEEDEGRAYVFLGSASGMSSSAAWTAEPDLEYASFGVSVSYADDVNGDGYADVIIGADFSNSGVTEFKKGRAYVYHGSSHGLSGTPDWVVDSGRLGDGFGGSVSTAGDLNGDGYADVIVGAPGHYQGRGKVFVYYGSPDGLSTSSDWTFSSGQAGANFGNSASTAGDVNGDGYSDVIIGGYLFDNGENNEGRAYVFYGSASGLSSSADWTAESNQAGAMFGTYVSTAGDVNGDGFADVIVGAPNFGNGQKGEGRAYVYYGSASGLSASADWTAESNQAGANFGNAVSTAGDVNGDGFADVIIGAKVYDNGNNIKGRAYVYYGSATGLSATADWTVASETEYAYLGSSVSTAGDVNGDGFADIIISEPKGGTTIRGGRAYLYYGGGGPGLARRPRQLKGGGTGQVSTFGRTSNADLGLELLARTGLGRTKVKLEWEIEPHATPFDGLGLGRSLDWVDSGDPADGAARLLETISGFAPGDYHWRARLLYHPAGPMGGGHSAWLVFDRAKVGQPDFRMFKKQGDPCTSDNECLGTHCVDNVCCDNECGGNDLDDCMACSVATGADVDGTCKDLTGTPCSDGVFCNGEDTCDAGECEIHAGNPCPGPDGDGNCSESCDEESDTCTAADPDDSVCDDGLFCNGEDKCSAGECEIHSGNPCPGPDRDGNCSESCDEQGDTCTAADLDGNVCDDGLFCNGEDTCSGGSCSAHTGDPCRGPDDDANCFESCNEDADSCDSQDPPGSLCNDTLFCNGEDRCNEVGVCLGTGNPCPGPDGDDDCAESCDEETDRCDALDPAGSACDDLDPLTGGDVCYADGRCQGELVPGTCGDPTSIEGLPYSVEHDTTARPSAVTSYGDGCGGDLAAGDRVYKLGLSSGDSIDVNAKPGPGYDVTLAILAECGEGEACLAFANQAGEGEAEHIGYEADEDQTVYVVVDGAAADESGSYDLEIK